MNDCINEFTKSASQKASGCFSDLAMQQSLLGEPLALREP